MSNRERGEVDITLAGKQFTLKVGTGALIAAQEAVSTPDRFVTVDQLFEQAARGRVLYVRVLLWAAMQKFQKGTTMAQVEEILDGATETEILEMLKTLGGTTTPDPRDVQELNVSTGDGGRPPQEAQESKTTVDGSGENSTSTPVASA